MASPDKMFGSIILAMAVHVTERLMKFSRPREAMSR